MRKSAWWGWVASILLILTLVTDGSRPARAGGGEFEGTVYSSVDLDNPSLPVTFEFSNISAKRFTGTARVFFGFDKGTLVYSGSGTRNSRGTVTFKGRVQRPGITLNLSAKGQLNIFDDQILGTYTVTGRWDGRKVNDIGGFTVSAD